MKPGQTRVWMCRSQRMGVAAYERGFWMKPGPLMLSARVRGSSASGNRQTMAWWGGRGRRGVGKVEPGKTVSISTSPLQEGGK